jgi:hypothetical protein
MNRIDFGYSVRDYCFDSVPVDEARCRHQQSSHRDYQQAVGEPAVHR